MKIVEVKELKFIHWDFNKDLKNSSLKSLDQYMKPVYVIKPDTNIKIGLQFQWRIKLEVEHGLLLNSIAEEVVFHPQMTSFSFEEMKDMMSTAFNRYNEAFIKKSKNEGYEMSIDYTVKDEEVIQILYMLDDTNIKFKLSKTFPKESEYLKVAREFPDFLNLALNDIKAEVISKKAYIELQENKDSEDGFQMEVMSNDTDLNAKMANRIQIFLHQWKGLN